MAARSAPQMVRHAPAQRNIRVERDIHVNRDVHFDRGYGWGSDRVWIDRGPVYVAPACVTPACVVPDACAVAVGDVPACVLAAVNAQGYGPIQSVELVRNGGREFYRVIVAPGGGNLDIRVGVDGRILSVTGC